ncbi:MAG TPA: HEAT repeat domain-containing protein [Acidimicrobiia bacterium]|jgi:HEAT repeat protein
MSDIGHRSGADRDDLDRAARYAASGAEISQFLGLELGAAVRTHPDARVRSAALGALVRGTVAGRARTAWRSAAADGTAAVRRRAAELAPAVRPVPVIGVLGLVADDDPLVAETAAWALGEVAWTGRTRARVVRVLAGAARSHPDPLVRESAVAALGAVGDARGLPAILDACGDRPPIRRRAVLALAPFDGPDVDAALAAALTDPDWQVRQAAEDLTDQSR